MRLPGKLAFSFLHERKFSLHSIACLQMLPTLSLMRVTRNFKQQKWLTIITPGVSTSWLFLPVLQLTTEMKIPTMCLLFKLGWRPQIPLPILWRLLIRKQRALEIGYCLIQSMLSGIRVNMGSYGYKAKVKHFCTRRIESNQDHQAGSGKTILS